MTTVKMLISYQWTKRAPQCDPNTRFGFYTILKLIFIPLNRFSCSYTQNKS